MTDQFLIATLATGINPANWTTVESLLGAEDITLRALEWSFNPYSKYIKLHDGKIRGVGAPIAVWSFKALRPEQRENLRDFCTGISADVYIRTPTNDTVAGVRQWGNFQAIMNWMTRSELVGINYVEIIEITFTMLVVL